MLSSALSLSTISHLLLTTLALPSNHRHSSVPDNLVDRGNQFAPRSADSLESSAFPPNISITDHLSTSPSSEANLTIDALTCYRPRPHGPQRPIPSAFDCYSAEQLILLDPDLFTARVWSGTRGLIVAEWRSGTCSISLAAQTPFSEDRFAPVLAAWAASHLIRTCVIGPYESGGSMLLGHGTTFGTIVKGTEAVGTAGGAVGGGTATS